MIFSFFLIAGVTSIWFTLESPQLVHVGFILKFTLETKFVCVFNAFLLGPVFAGTQDAIARHHQDDETILGSGIPISWIYPPPSNSGK